MFKKYYLRVILLLVGIVLMSIGGSLFVIADIGSDAIMVFNQGIATKLNIDVGKGIIIGNAIFFILILIINRKTIGIGTFAITLLIGPIIDLILKAKMIPTPSIELMKYVYNLSGNLVGGLGIALYIHSALGLSPFEGIIVTIQKRTKLKFSIIKIIEDAFFFIVGILLGGVFGPGSIITVFILGPIIGFFLKLVKKYIPLKIDK